ncbi:MAG TPA: hypothetical protein VGM10_34465 [Actinocrinis sp.]
MNMRSDDILHDTDENSAALRGALGATADRLRANVAMDRPLHQITARGRRLRNKRRCAVGTAGVAAAATIALGAVGLPGTAPGTVPGTAQHPTAAKDPNVDLAGFSLQSEPDGTIVVTIKQFESEDVPALQRYLDEAGINAIVRTMQPNGGVLEPLTCPGSQMSSQEQAQLNKVLELPVDSGGIDEALALDPDAMPAGATFVLFVHFSPVQLNSPQAGPFASVLFGLYDGAVPDCIASPAP